MEDVEKRVVVIDTCEKEKGHDSKAVSYVTGGANEVQGIGIVAENEVIEDNDKRPYIG